MHLVRDRQAVEAEKGFYCTSVTEAFCVCCPTFGRLVHMRITRVAGVATAAMEEREEVEVVSWHGSSL